MESRPGTYVLVLRCTGRKRIRVGKWGQLETNPGYYLYVGSAFGPGGVRARVSRHRRRKKAKRWHIDYLRAHAGLQEVWYTHGSERLEHKWARALEQAQATALVEGFGCSDCRCGSHLFYVAREAGLQECRGALGSEINCWQEEGF